MKFTTGMLVELIREYARHVGTLIGLSQRTCGHFQIYVDCKTCGRRHEMHGDPADYLKPTVYGLSTSELEKMGLLRAI